MPTLAGKLRDIRLTLRPAVENPFGEGPIARYHLEFLLGKDRLLTASFAMERHQLEETRRALMDIAANRRSSFFMVGWDLDFAFSVDREELGPEDAAIGFWVGEPYQLMKGYRFVAMLEEIGRFARELGPAPRSEEEAC